MFLAEKELARCRFCFEGRNFLILVLSYRKVKKKTKSLFNITFLVNFFILVTLYKKN